MTTAIRTVPSPRGARSSACGAGLMPSPAKTSGSRTSETLPQPATHSASSASRSSRFIAPPSRRRRDDHVGDGAGDQRAQARAAALRRLDLERAVERGQAVDEPAQAGTGLDVGAADAVVLDEHDHVLVVAPQVDAARCSACAYLATLVSASATTK